MSFRLYDRPFTIPLENFAYHCKLLFWGSLDEPPRAEFESFLTSLVAEKIGGETRKNKEHSLSRNSVFCVI